MKRLTILLAALGALLLVPAAQAFAAPPELPFLETFGSANQPSFTEAAGMAVDRSTGDLYVIEFEESGPGEFKGLLSRYHEDGTPANFSALSSTNEIDGHAGEADHTPQGEILSTFGLSGNAEEVQVAIDNSGGPNAGDVYVTNGSNGVIDIFKSTGEYIGELTESSEGPLGETCGVAVDPSGNVYVGNFGGAVHKYSPAGTNIANFPFEANCSIAAGAGPTNGFIFASHFEGSTEKIDSTSGAEEYAVDPGGIDTTVSVNPVNGHVFAAASEKVNEFDASGPSSAEVSSTEVLSLTRGVAVNGKTGDVYVTRLGDANVAVYAGPSSSGPTNRRALTLTKSAGGPGATGTVSSKPKGINCGSACDSAVASMYEGSAVTLTAKPSSGDSFVKWEGGDCEGIVATTCTVTMDQTEEVKAVFSGSTKPIVDPQALSVSKGGSSGTGTVKAAGLACEAECSEETVLYQGPISLPKPKPGKTVELKETPAYGSSFTGWSGACSGSEPTCKVTMEEAEEVTAEFAAKPTTTLTIEKNSYETGDGTVSSKPKGINCATACTTQAMSVPSGEAIVLKEKPATGMTFAGWSGGGCSGTAETCTVSPSSATTVHATFSGSPKAIVNPQVLTLTKAGSGFGTVKAAGLACENECTSAAVLFQGPITLPKPKPGKTVLLKATSAPGSKTVVWTGCESNPTPGECVVVMEEAENVTATFDELE